MIDNNKVQIPFNKLELKMQTWFMPVSKQVARKLKLERSFYYDKKKQLMNQITDKNVINAQHDEGQFYLLLMEAERIKLLSLYNKGFILQYISLILALCFTPTFLILIVFGEKASVNLGLMTYYTVLITFGLISYFGFHFSFSENKYQRNRITLIDTIIQDSSDGL